MYSCGPLASFAFEKKKKKKRNILLQKLFTFSPNRNVRKGASRAQYTTTVISIQNYCMVAVMYWNVSTCTHLSRGEDGPEQGRQRHRGEPEKGTVVSWCNFHRFFTTQEGAAKHIADSVSIVRTYDTSTVQGGGRKVKGTSLNFLEQPEKCLNASSSFTLNCLILVMRKGVQCRAVVCLVKLTTV